MSRSRQSRSSVLPPPAIQTAFLIYISCQDVLVEYGTFIKPARKRSQNLQQAEFPQPKIERIERRVATCAINCHLESNPIDFKGRIEGERGRTPFFYLSPLTLSLFFLSSLFEKLLPVEPCQTDQTGTQEKHGGRFGNGCWV